MCNSENYDGCKTVEQYTFSKTKDETTGRIGAIAE